MKKVIVLAGGTPVASAIGGAECRPGHYAGGGIAGFAVPATRPGEGFAAGLSIGEAWKFIAGDGGSGALGQTGREDQYDQSGHHHHAVGQ